MNPEMELNKQVESLTLERMNKIVNFAQCRPIHKTSDIEDCLLNPPDWVDRVIPLKKRSGYVIPNTFTDCHSEEKHFFVRDRLDSRTVPKTLVCHDYKGGYLTDSYIPLEEGIEEAVAKEGYPFYNWSHIDYFVYFSHHFITIPPLGWINSGHKNGVKVLGTIITESTEGTKICDEEIFSNKDSMREFVYNLTEITRIFRIDGWLLNIENPVKNPDILCEFVEILTKRIHEQNSENVVIWYDSVTKDGKLKWQDQLNDENKCFFDYCDGIYLNYGWNEEKLINTVKYAGTRHFDVFVGVDVFGRNMFGGGMFNTYKALDLISKYNLSIAIFAPGWTYETLPQSPEKNIFARFLIQDDTFWTSLWPYLYTHPIIDFFQTNFHIGLDIDNYSLFMQKQQSSKILHPENIDNIPDHDTRLTLNNACGCLKRGYFDSKSVCLISSENLKKGGAQFVHHIFVCDIKLKGKIGVYFITRKINALDLTNLGITMLTFLNSGSIRKVELLGQEKLNLVDNMSVLEVNPMQHSEIKDNSPLYMIYKKYNENYRAAANSQKLSLSIFEFSTSSCGLLEIGATLHNGHSIYLVEFGILPL